MKILGHKKKKPPLPYILPKDRYQMAKEPRKRTFLAEFVEKGQADPAFKVSAIIGQHPDWFQILIYKHC